MFILNVTVVRLTRQSRTTEPVIISISVVVGIAATVTAPIVIVIAQDSTESEKLIKHWYATQ